MGKSKFDAWFIRLQALTEKPLRPEDWTIRWFDGRTPEEALEDGPEEPKTLFSVAQDENRTITIDWHPDLNSLLSGHEEFDHSTGEFLPSELSEMGERLTHLVEEILDSRFVVKDILDSCFEDCDFDEDYQGDFAGHGECAIIKDKLALTQSALRHPSGGPPVHQTRDSLVEKLRAAAPVFSQLGEAADKIVSLREALFIYAAHKHGCDRLRDPAMKCSCGLQEILER